MSCEGPAVEVPGTTEFYIVPRIEAIDKFKDFQAVKDAVKNVLKSSKISLKVKRMVVTKKNSVKIEAVDPDLEKISSSSELKDAGLMIRRHEKLNPRIIIHGVPVGMSTGEICDEIIALNLRGLNDPLVKPVFTFRPQNNGSLTSCVVEVSSEIRRALRKHSHIYVAYSACKYADYIRLLQCYRCSRFGHMAVDCKADPVCGRCAMGHETREYPERDCTLICINCKRSNSMCDFQHAATDKMKCPIILRRYVERAKNIDYGS